MSVIKILSHIIDFIGKYKFIIALGYKGDLVKQYLDIVHDDLDFKFVHVDKYEGKGSTTYSMNKCKNLNEPFIFMYLMQLQSMI